VDGWMDGWMERPYWCYLDFVLNNCFSVNSNNKILLMNFRVVRKICYIYLYIACTMCIKLMQNGNRLYMYIYPCA
jgi:hypothetical protein